MCSLEHFKTYLLFVINYKELSAILVMFKIVLLYKNFDNLIYHHTQLV